VTIGNTDGGALRAQLEQGAVTLEIAVAGQRIDKVARNIVGVKRGTTHPDRFVIVAGHYDSWYAGAFDNCTAVGSLLHIVEELKDEDLAYTTYFIGWDAEEPGLVGSYDWIARHQDLIPKAVLNVNLEETASALFVNGDKLDTPSPQLAGTTSSPTLAATILATGATSLHTPVFGPIGALRGLSGGIIPTDIEGFYAQGVQGVTTAGLSPYYHTTGDTEDKINAADLEKISTWLTNLVRNVQAIPPDNLAMREVPTVKVTAPKSAAAGAPVDVEIEVTGTDGAPVTGVAPVVLADQRHNWAVAEGVAEEVGGGSYRYTVPAGATDAFVTRLRVTITTDDYLANGFAKVDQRRGGLLEAGNVCLRPQLVKLRASQPIASVRGRRGRIKARGRRVTVDLRNVSGRLFKLQLTGADGARQKRVYRPCA
jgi:hypothetical protein